MALARPAAYAQLLFLALAFAMLTTLFVVQDFSVLYVARNSNSLLPLAYRFSAVWGGHEGSLLLWVLILGIWTGAVARLSHALPQPVVARVLAIGRASFRERVCQSVEISCVASDLKKHNTTTS